MTILLAFFMLINFLDKIVMGLVAVPMMNELKITPTEFGMIGGSFFWLFAIAGILGGFLADRINAKWMIAAMAAAWALIQLPIVFTTSIATIMAVRVVLGAAEGPAWPVAVHALYKWFPNEKRTLPISILGQGSGIGLLLAGIIIPFVTATWGWRANFLVLGLVGLIWLLLWTAFGKEGNLSESATQTAKKNVSYGRLFSDKTLLACMFAHFASYWSLAITLTWIPAYMEKGLGFDSLSAGHIFSACVAINLVFGLGTGWLSQRLMLARLPSRTARGVLTAGALLISAVCYVSMLTPDMSPFVRIVLLGIGAGLSQAIYYTGPAIIGEITPTTQRGAILAIDNSVASIAGIIAPVVMGYLIQYSAGGAAAGYQNGFAVTGAFLAIAGVIAWAFLDPGTSARRNLGAAVPAAE